MPELLFRLRGVPDDEAEDVRRLLDENGIRYYETSAGNWKIAVPALWLPDTSQLDEARDLLQAYQEQRLRNAREAYRAQQEAGMAPTVWSRIRESPIRFILYLGAAGVVLYLTLMPFLSLGGAG